MTIIRGRHFLLNDIFDFVCEGETIREIRPPGGAPSRDAPALGSADHLIAPGLVDIQVNGYAGVDFCSARVTAGQVESAASALAEAGVTAFCPTVITQSRESIAASMAAIRRACEMGGAAAERIVGIHLEGPYITAENGARGAHPLEHVRAPDWEEFLGWQEAAGGRIRLVTLAPEREGALEFIGRCHAAGIRVAIGHHAATRGQINAAVAAGATLSTHLGNGSHAVLPRHPNYIWEQLANDALQASMIADGYHLPPAVVKTFFRTKTPERLILVSDVVWLAGLAPGRYQYWGNEVELGADRSVRIVGTNYLGGSALKLIDGVNNVMAFAGATLPEAIQMAATNPAEYIGARGRGRLTTGSRADLLLLRPCAGGGVELETTVVGGRVAWKAAT